jgi:hypothetical protein
MTPSGAAGIIRSLYSGHVEVAFGKPHPRGFPAEGVGTSKMKIYDEFDRIFDNEMEVDQSAVESSHQSHPLPIAQGTGLYCPQMKCVDTVLAVLHTRMLKTGDVRDTEIDRYLGICSFLQSCAPPPRNELYPDPNHAGEVGTGPSQRIAARGAAIPPRPSVRNVRRITIGCLCGVSVGASRDGKSHNCVLEKEREFKSHFDVCNIYEKGTQRSAVIPVSAFVQSEEEAMQYRQLPDLGIYIRAMFLRVYFSLGVQKYVSKISQFSTHRFQPVSASQNLSSSIICSLVQDSIPCMKKAKRSQKGLEFREPVDTEVSACINVVLGTLLGLYPRCVKRPTFQGRVHLYGRLTVLLYSSCEAKLHFIITYPSLVKICFMEYTFNTILDFMPCEDELLSTLGSMKIFRTVCQNTCDGFRQESILTGLEVSLNAYEPQIWSLMHVYT